MSYLQKVFIIIIIIIIIINIIIINSIWCRAEQNHFSSFRLKEQM